VFVIYSHNTASLIALGLHLPGKGLFISHLHVVEAVFSLLFLASSGLLIRAIVVLGVAVNILPHFSPTPPFLPFFSELSLRLRTEDDLILVKVPVGLQVGNDFLGVWMDEVGPGLPQRVNDVVDKTDLKKI
jgi:hypothetical protein